MFLSEPQGHQELLESPVALKKRFHSPTVGSSRASSRHQSRLFAEDPFAHHPDLDVGEGLLDAYQGRAAGYPSDSSHGTINASVGPMTHSYADSKTTPAPRKPPGSVDRWTESGLDGVFSKSRPPVTQTRAIHPNELAIEPTPVIASRRRGPGPPPSVATPAVVELAQADSTPGGIVQHASASQPVVTHLDESSSLPLVFDLNAAFDRIDTDGNGVITRDEVTQPPCTSKVLNS